MIVQESKTLRQLIRILVRNLGVLEKDDADNCGITLTQCHAIVEIGRKERISLIDLAILLGVDKSAMSRTVNNLVESELVVRDVDPLDRRYVSIALTEQGQEVFKNTEESMEIYYLSIFESIPEGKRTQVLESLQILSDIIKDKRGC